MKKIFLIIAGICLFTTGFSQLTYGPKVGFNFVSLPGFQGGGFLNAELFDRVGFQVDFLYTMKGDRKTGTVQFYDQFGMPTTTAQSVTSTYYKFFDLPLCFYFAMTKHVRGFVGPQLSASMGAHQKYKLNGNTKDSDVSGIIAKRSFCAGIDINLDSPVTIGLRFVSNKFTKSGDEQSLSSIMLNLGYKIDW